MHHVCPPTVEWYYDVNRGVIMVTTTTTVHTILYLGHLDVAAAPPVLAPAIISEFLQPPPATTEYEPMSLDLPPFYHLFCPSLGASPGIGFNRLTFVGGDVLPPAVFLGVLLEPVGSLP